MYLGSKLLEVKIKILKKIQKKIFKQKLTVHFGNVINKPKYDCHLKIHMHACSKMHKKCACQKGDGDVY